MTARSSMVLEHAERHPGAAPRAEGEGKDSSALAVYMRGKIPSMEYVFCDTGKELPETYEYLAKLEAYLGQPVVRLNPERGFDHWLEVYGGYLPSPRMRWCTRMLKPEALRAAIFCFFQRKREWAGLLEKHPEPYEQAKAYEKQDPESGRRFTVVGARELGRARSTGAARRNSARRQRPGEGTARGTTGGLAGCGRERGGMCDLPDPSPGNTSRTRRPSPPSSSPLPASRTAVSRRSPQALRGQSPTPAGMIDP